MPLCLRGESFVFACNSFSPHGHRHSQEINATQIKTTHLILLANFAEGFSPCLRISVVNQSPLVPLCLCVSVVNDRTANHRNSPNRAPPRFHPASHFLQARQPESI